MGLTWEDLSRGEIEPALEWAAAQPWSRAMAECRQDVEWHAEGDVWTHTKLVCAQLPLLEEWPTLDARARTLLIFTALFHDAAKPLTTKPDPETGRLHSPKHAVHGEHLARAALRDVGCDLTTREEIARLVRFHGRPPFLTEKADAAREVISLSWAVENRLLYLFALADNRGRVAVSTNRPEENLHYWKLVAEECECFTRPYEFANDHARFLFFRQADFDRHYVPHEAYRCRVTVMSGLQGSGKDTWLAKNRSDLPVVSLDELREEMDVDPTDNQGVILQAAKERCRELLRAGTSFAFNATNLLRATRQRWIELFADYNARIEIVYVEPPLAEVFARNKRRNRNVPERVIREWAAKLEPPTWNEAHQLLLVDH